jgi:hypothetical protein
MEPSCLKKNQQTLEISVGTCPTKPGLLHGNCEAIMRIVVFPSSGERFSDFWIPQQFVDMKASDGTMDDKLRYLGKVILKDSECEVSTEAFLALLYRECSSSRTVTRLLAIRWCKVANPTIILHNKADFEMAARRLIKQPFGSEDPILHSGLQGPSNGNPEERSRPQHLRCSEEFLDRQKTPPRVGEEQRYDPGSPL